MALLDHEKQIQEYEETLRRLQGQAEGKRLLAPEEIRHLEEKLSQLKQRVYSALSPMERLEICRHAKRPRSLDYIEMVVEGFQELHGDRCYRDDPAIVGGLGRIGGQKFVIVAQEKGSDTESRLHRNFGMPHPEGFRKALRLMEMAGKFGLPILSLVDTMGAYPGLTAEERGQAWAIATNLREMMRIPTPIIVVIIGEAGSGGALAIACGDRVGMLEHGYYSVISPEACASILWKNAEEKSKAAAALKFNAEHLLQFGVIDAIITEPLGGAHHDPKAAALAVADFIASSLQPLKGIPAQTLLAQRYEKFRKIGAYQ
jgi:acetyl-CoA carboxylase carboxyl transferase subunit alpha